MRKVFICFIVISLFSCSSNIKEEAIDRISVHSVGLGVLTPIPITEESIRNLEAYKIEDKDTIDLIKEYISKLQPSKNDRIVENIYMVSDFYYKNKVLYTLRFDKGKIEFDGKVYEKNDTLIEILYRNEIRYKRKRDK